MIIYNEEYPYYSEMIFRGEAYTYPKNAEELEEPCEDYEPEEEEEWPKICGGIEYWLDGDWYDGKKF